MSTTHHMATGQPSASAPDQAALELDRHCRNIAPHLLEGRFVPVLGAGVNLCQRPHPFTWKKGCEYLPSAEELAKHLAAQSAYTPDRYRPHQDAAAAETYEPVFDLIQVSQYVEVLQGSVELYRTLHDVFDREYKPSVVHRFLAQLAQVNPEGQPLLMLTTNYDYALEDAFRAARVPYDLITYVTDYPKKQRGRFAHSRWHPDGPTDPKPKVIMSPNKYTDVGVERPAIVKIHGAPHPDGDYKHDNYVISEDDYIDYLMQPNTTSRLPVMISARLSESPFLFLGYSLSDWNLRVLLRRIWDAQWLSVKSWSVRLDADEMDEVFWQQQSVLTLRSPLFEYILALRRVCVETFLRSFSHESPKERQATLRARPEALFEQLHHEDRPAMFEGLALEQLKAFHDDLPEERRQPLVTALPETLLARLREATREDIDRHRE
jgi:hypothetical protein